MRKRCSLNKMIVYFLFNFLFIFCISSHCFSQLEYRFSNNDLLIPKEHMLQDIDTIVSNLQKLHPGLYRYITPQQFEKKIHLLKSNLPDSMRRNGFCLKVMQLLSTIGDGHMTAVLDDNDLEKGFMVYPLDRLSFKIIDDRLYAMHKYMMPPVLENGTEVLDINGVRVKKIIDSLKTYQFSDAGADPFKIYNLEKGAFATLYHEVFGSKDSVRLMIKAKDGATHVFINAVKDTTNTIFMQSESNDYKIDSQYAYLKIGSFGGNVWEPDFDSLERLHDFFALINNTKRNLIVDLRNNNGGYSTTMFDLYSHFISKESPFFKPGLTPPGEELARQHAAIKESIEMLFKPVQPNKLHFDGTVYVIVNKGTFSAAAFLAAKMQELRNVIIVGEETGGSRNFATAGIFATTTAPHSQIMVTFGMISYTNHVKHRAIGIQKPKTQIKNTITDVVEKKDPEMNWILKKILSSNTNH